VENVVTIEEHPKPVRTANDANDTIWRPERSQGLLEGSTGRVPKQRLFILRVSRDGGKLPGQDQSAPQIRMRPPLMRVAPMHHRIDAVESAFEEVLIGLELERVWHNAAGISQHAIFGYEGITFDAMRTGMGCFPTGLRRGV
jgi:hypothetical protein